VELSRGSPADIIRMDVALIERAYHDHISAMRSGSADEQVVPLERKCFLEDNGFRVGLIGSGKPCALQTLLTSERSCANPRRFPALRQGGSAGSRATIAFPALPD